MADIFISYKHEDINVVKKMAECLNKSGLTVWWDHNIPAGYDYDVVIENELKTAKCVIVLWTGASVISRNVKDEANEGLERNALLPVVIGNIRPPIGFRNIQSIVWENADYDSDKFAEFVTQVKNLIEARSVVQTNLNTDKGGADIPRQAPKTDKDKGANGNKRAKKKYYIIGAVAFLILITFFLIRSYTKDNTALNATVLIDNRPVSNVQVKILETKSEAKTNDYGTVNIAFKSDLKDFTILFSAADSTFTIDTLISISKEKLSGNVIFHLIAKKNSTFGAPTLLLPENAQTFNIFPRTTRFVWTSVKKAVSYNIEIQFGNFDQAGNVNWSFLRKVITVDTTFTYDFVGAQPGRWRVYSINSNKEYSDPSGWFVFTYSR